MRKTIAAFALALAACGTQVGGNWTASISQGSQTCSGSMSLTQKGAQLSGTWGCGNLSGDCDGSLDGNNISLNFHMTGYNPALMTGTATDNSITGKLNGSGFTDADFHATK